MSGWQFSVFAHNNLQIRKETPLCAYVMVGDYHAVQRAPNELNWVRTTPGEMEFDVDTDYSENVAFGTACIGSGGSLTIGYWTTSGQQLEARGDFTALTALNLVTTQGTAQDFAGSAAQSKSSLKQFLLGANTTNMANMLSAELSAMKLNVLHGFVNGTALIYAPGLSACGMNGGSPAGFISINDLMSAANQSLAGHPLTQDGSPDRSCQEALKNALDDANNNKNFVQSSPCGFTFGD
jgi:hypothetical protein